MVLRCILNNGHGDMVTTHTPLSRSLLTCLSLLFALGCAPERYTFECLPPAGGGNSGVLQSSNEDIVPAFVVDRTPSMQGYTVSLSSEKTEYIRSLWLIDRLLADQFNNQPGYYEFGTERRTSQAMEQQSSVGPAFEPSFYSSSGDGFQQDTLIQYAIQPFFPEEKRELIIVVTDLYQKNADQREIVRIIRDSYLSQGKSVGFIGLRSEFRGLFHDVGIDDLDNNRHESMPDLRETFRPFYIIVLGHSSLVSRFLHGFYTLSPDSGIIVPAERIVMFTHADTLNADIVMEDMEDASSADGIMKKANLNDRQLLVSPAERNVDLFEVDSRKYLPSTGLRYILNHEKPPFVLIPYEYEYEIVLSRYSDSRARNGTDFYDSTGQEPSILNVDFSEAHSTLDTHRFAVSFDLSQDSVEEGIYLFTVQFTPLSLRPPNWWQDWNIDENDLKTFGVADGTKTYGLELLMKSLVQQSLSLASEDMSTSYCYGLHVRS